MHQDDWNRLHGDPEINAAANRFAARVRPRSPAPGTKIFTISLLMGSDQAFVPVPQPFLLGVQGGIPVPQRGRPIQWFLQEMKGSAGNISLLLEYGPYSAPNRTFIAFDTIGLAGASSARDPQQPGTPLAGWPVMFEAGSIVRVTANSASGVEIVLLWIDMDAMPVPLGYNPP